MLASGTMTPLEYADEVDGEIAATVFADKNNAPGWHVVPGIDPASCTR